MKVRKQLQFALLLASSCVVFGQSGAQKRAEPQAPKIALSKDQQAAVPKHLQDAALALNKNAAGAANAADVAKAANAVNTKPALPTKPYVGTEDAPVDGLDGKPHAGPFVDTKPEQTQTLKGSAATESIKSVPTSLGRLKEEIPNIPEKNDGVMNDESRPVPRPGTTGTEGGMSEKEKVKLLQGPNVENTPQTPKVQPPLPQSEQERIKVDAEKNGVSDSQAGSKKDTKDSESSATADESSTKKGSDFSGALGIEKPADLPDKSHNIPHPDPKNPNGRDGATPDTRKGWLTDTMPYTEGQTNPTPKQASKVGSGASGDSHDDSFEEWFHSFVVSFTMIIFTEIGDKTFLVAALMAMRHPRLTVFTSALSALTAMTILSAVLGHLAPTLLPKRLTTFAAAILFLIFGGRMLKEGLAMSKSAGVGDEMKSVEAELEEKEHDLAVGASQKDANLSLLEAGRNEARHDHGNKTALSGLANLLGLILSPAWVQTFIMTFLGEWGDRSQIATIAMAAGQDYWWVTLGAILGHACCTGLAVIGGAALAGRVSMRVVTIGGAAAFLFFGLLYLFECYVEV